jgi:hypothetical protein
MAALQSVCASLEVAPFQLEIQAFCPGRSASGHQSMVERRRK